MQIIHNNLLSNQLCKWGFILGIFCEWAHVICPCKKNTFAPPQTRQTGTLIHIHWNWTNKADKAEKKLHALLKYESALEQFKYCRWGWDILFVITVRKELQEETEEEIGVVKRGAD